MEPARENKDRTSSKDSRVSGWWTLAVLTACLLVFLLWLFVQPSTPTETKDFVQAVGILLAAVAGLGGLYLTWQGQKLTRENVEQQLQQARESTNNQLEQARESTNNQLEQARQSQEQNQRLTMQGQITERFTRAIDQLGASEGGEKKVEIRLGGIYALERIARDSERDCWTIAEVLSGYIRQNARWFKGELTPDEDSELSSQLKDYRYAEYQHRELDIQAALNVIRVLLDQCKRPTDGKAPKRLYLSKTDLSFGDLREANLEEARFRDANLFGIRLNNSNLRNAHLRRAILKRAHLRGSNLEGADLEGVNFEKASLKKATFTAAELHAVTFNDAMLHGADLRGAKRLTQKQLDVAFGDENTQLPPHLKSPTHWGVKSDEQIEGD